MKKNIETQLATYGTLKTLAANEIFIKQGMICRNNHYIKGRNLVCIPIITATI
jgi:hypothetical protein